MVVIFLRKLHIQVLSTVRRIQLKHTVIPNLPLSPFYSTVHKMETDFFPFNIRTGKKQHAQQKQKACMVSYLRRGLHKGFSPWLGSLEPSQGQLIIVHIVITKVLGQDPLTPLRPALLNLSFALEHFQIVSEPHRRRRAWYLLSLSAMHIEIALCGTQELLAIVLVP